MGAFLYIMLILCFGKLLPGTSRSKLKIRCSLLVNIRPLVLLEKARLLAKDQRMGASQHFTGACGILRPSSSLDLNANLIVVDV